MNVPDKVRQKVTEDPAVCRPVQTEDLVPFSRHSAAADPPHLRSLVPRCHCGHKHRIGNGFQLKDRPTNACFIRVPEVKVQ